jgi:cytochrome P450
MSQIEAPPPPGSGGLPLLGETLDLLRDPFGFVESRARRYGPVFRTRLLGRPTAVITGPDATGKFIDAEDVQREGAMPGNIQTLFGGRALPVLDGEEHHARKRAVMAAFSAEALDGYVPKIAAVVRDMLGRWAAAEEVHAVGELRRMAIEVIAGTMLDLGPGPELEAMRDDYAEVLRGFRGLPLPLPGTAYTKAKNAIERALARFRRQISAHEQAPRDDGLQRILGTRALDADAVARELHHLILAGLIVWAWCARLLVELDRHPEMRARLVREVSALPPEGPPPRDALDRLAYLDWVVSEVRRSTPVVPVAFGKARRTFTFGGYRIQAGWMVMWGPSASHMRPEVYPDPEAFNPERFGPERAEPARHPHAFAPNGAGDAMDGHKCAGYQLAPTLAKVFAVELLRGYTWTLAPGQELSYDWAHTPPPPKDGLRLKLLRR